VQCSAATRRIPDDQIVLQIKESLGRCARYTTGANEESYSTSYIS
jgi:hypothetical protein